MKKVFTTEQIINKLRKIGRSDVEAAEAGQGTGEQARLFAWTL